MTVAIDLFAGWGGFTAGATAAGVRVAWAANHWPLAVEVHARNHPDTVHACQDLRQADWTALPAYDVMLASPACQGHSPASQPKRRHFHDAMRATAWAVIDCAEVTRPKAIIVENVLNFTRWELFSLWREALVRLGYHPIVHEVEATAFGVPQRRRRVIITATRKVVAIPLAREADLEPAFAPCIDWTARGWRPVRAAPVAVRERIAKGRRNCGRVFLSQHVTGHPGVPLHEPIRTITTKDQWIFVEGDRYRSLTLRELARGMAFADSYTWPEHLSRVDVVKGLGNAIPPPMAAGAVRAVCDAIH